MSFFLSGASLSPSLAIVRFGGKARNITASVNIHCFYVNTLKTAKGLLICGMRGPVAQWITRLPTEQKIPGSNPGRFETFLSFSLNVAHHQDHIMAIAGLYPDWCTYVYCRTNVIIVIDHGRPTINSNMHGSTLNAARLIQVQRKVSEKKAWRIRVSIPVPLTC